MVTAAFTAPLLTACTAYAVAIPGGCTLTYLGLVGGEPITPIVSAPPGSVTIDYDAAVTHVKAQATHTSWYIGCI